MCPRTLLCRPNPNRIEVPVCSSWYLRPPPLCSSVSSLYLAFMYSSTEHWTSEPSSFVALTTRRPLIWWLSHWCIDGAEPVSLPASLSPSLQLSSYIDSQGPKSGLIKTVFTCQLPLLVFQVQRLKVARCIDQLGKKTFETPHSSHDSHKVCLHVLKIHPLNSSTWAAKSFFFSWTLKSRNNSSNKSLSISTTILIFLVSLQATTHSSNS